MTLSTAEAYDFLARHRLAVMSTVSEHGVPEAALINYGVTKDLEIIFETLQTSRKFRNLCSNPKVAMVMGWGRECLTCQYEGVVGLPSENALPSLLEIYFAARPEGRGHRGWPDLVYLCAKPTWVRLSNYDLMNWNIKELDLRGAGTVRLLPLPLPPE